MLFAVVVVVVAVAVAAVVVVVVVVAAAVVVFVVFVVSALFLGGHRKSTLGVRFEEFRHGKVVTELFIHAWCLQTALKTLAHLWLNSFEALPLLLAGADGAVQAYVEVAGKLSRLPPCALNCAFFPHSLSP